MARSQDVDVVITEIGGTVGDIEPPFLEAIRQFRNDVGRRNVLYIHVTLIPFLGAAGELKTKPTQHSVSELRSIGIQPDIIVCRVDRPIGQELKDKIALFTDVEPRAVIAATDASDIYHVPLNLQAEGLDRLVMDKLGLKGGPLDLSEWTGLIDRIHSTEGTVRVALVGKYVQLQDAYLSVVEALRHGGIYHRRDVEIVWVDAESLRPEEIRSRLAAVDGILVPGGFGVRGIEGKTLAVRYARENRVPFLGICLGMQVAVVEFARNVMGMVGANSSEFDPSTPYAVIDLLPEQKDLEDLGGTMRLGSYPTKLYPDTIAYRAYGEEVIYERHRHRYEFNNIFRAQMVDAGLVISGVSPDERLVEIVELEDHPWFLGCQFHAEFKSRPTRPQPIFRDFVGAAIACSCGVGGKPSGEGNPSNEDEA